MSSLKNRTLKKHYEQSVRREKTLAEAFDVKKAEQASAAIAKLEALIPQEAAMFRKALEAAKTDLQKASAGGLLQGIKNAFSDPLLKATAMANALHAGFAALPKVLGMYLPPQQQKEGEKSTFELVPQEKQQLFIDTMTKAFAPASTGTIGGDIKGLFSNNVMPYIQNLNAAVKELMMNVAPNGAFKLGQQAAATPPAEIQKAAAEQDKSGQTAPNQAPANANANTNTNTAVGTTGEKATAGTNATTGLEQTKPTEEPPPPPKAPSPQKKLQPGKDDERLKDIAQFVATRTTMDLKKAQEIINFLANHNALTDFDAPARVSNKLAGDVKNLGEPVKGPQVGGPTSPSAAPGGARGGV